MTLGSKVVDQRQDSQCLGCVLDLNRALLEFYDMTEADSRFSAGTSSPIANDKIDLQITTAELNHGLTGFARRLLSSTPSLCHGDNGGCNYAIQMEC